MNRPRTLTALSRDDAYRVCDAARGALRGHLDEADAPTIVACLAAADTLGVSVAALLGVADAELTATPE
ncbi:hypothetical protein [Gordonia rhizosphera]|uniref:Putative transcriptional regulator n=1 Tax=Gordonia rhizosphera NBRC 16068 TaxID=1108045 RepID=K6VSX2_9ACTN|nr:hypothetical protein [Gordonia rhizosphera]GAB90010.1 putative transcriptional regulator [Gordonia rhizosphera NBRC 16068]